MATNDFMLQLHKQLLEKTYGAENHKLSETTAAAYIKTLYMLNDKKPFKTLSFLKGKEAIEKHLSGYAESTRKTLYATVSSVLSLFKDKPAYKAIYKHYYDKMMSASKVSGGADTAVKSEAQKENWLTWDEVQKVKAELLDKVMKFVDNKTLSVEEYKTLLDLVVLSLYTDVAPRRNQDYLDMVVYKALKKDKVEELPKDKNYVIIADKKPKQFIFNIYKTSKKYGTQTTVLPTSLAFIINTYLKFHPLAKTKAKEVQFLVSAAGLPLSQANAITRILNGVFHKNIGSSMLRHIYLSSKMDITDMKADAAAMGHSLTEQQKYLKSDSPAPSENPVALPLPTVPLPASHC